MVQPEIISQTETISQTDRAAVLDSIAGGCCIISCEEERILYMNESALYSYACPDRETFLRMTGGFFRGMIEAEDYCPLQDFFGVGRKILTEREEETADGRDSAPAEQNDPAQKSSIQTDRSSGAGGDSAPVSDKSKAEKGGVTTEEWDRLGRKAEPVPDAGRTAEESTGLFVAKQSALRGRGLGHESDSDGADAAGTESGAFHRAHGSA